MLLAGNSVTYAAGSTYAVGTAPGTEAYGAVSGAVGRNALRLLKRIPLKLVML